MRLQELFYLNKSIKKFSLFISPAIYKVSGNIPLRSFQIKSTTSTKKRTTLVTNTLISYLFNKFSGINSLIDLAGVDLLKFLKKYDKARGRYLLKYTFSNLKEQDLVNFHISLSSDFFSLEKIIPSTIWLQREVWDMYGIIFKGSTDHRRILTDYGFKSFPLRKDFPVFGNVEIYYDIEMEELLYKKIDASQENRYFGYNKTNFWF